MGVSTSAAFFDLLKESDVLSPEQLTRAENLIGDGSDIRAAAKRLVKADLLTRWQASQLLKGSSLLSLGKYVLLERLPWGSNHAVFVATHPTMDRKVALNVLDRASSSRTDSRETFIADARAIAALDHRNLIHVYDIVEAEGRCFLVMEYVEGQNLHDLVKTQERMSVEVAADIIRQIADGLSHAHKNKLIHGGLRPTNVILEEDGAVKIIDLGLSRFDDLSKKPSGNDDSKILSIADYLSPEQAAGQLPTAAADIYSLGCLAYFLLSGQAPFARGSYTQRLQRHQHDKAPDVRKLRGDTPEGLAKIVTKMMAKEPSDRYATSNEIVENLEAWWREYGPTVAVSKPKPETDAGPDAERSSKAPVETAPSKVPVAAAPPPKKNGRPVPAKNNDSGTESGGFPGIHTAKAAPRAANDLPQEHPIPGPGDESKFQKISQRPGPPRNRQLTKGSIVSDSHTSTSPLPMAPPESPAPNPATTPPSKSGIPLPIILGALGALLLLLALGGGVGGYWYFASSHGDPDAVSQADEESPSQPPATADGADPPDSSGSESDGQAQGKPPDDEPALPVPGEPEDGEQDNEPANGGAEPNVEPQPDPEPEPPQPEPPQPDTPVVEPPQDEGNNKPPDDGGNDKPPENPFRSLAGSVELPPVSGQAAPVPLGKIHLPEGIACYIDLLGGEQAAPNSKGVFALDRARNGLADRDWEIKLEFPEAEPLVVANLSLEGEDLQFEWTSAAAEQEASPYLCNCLLNLRTAEFEHFSALRKPLQVSALPFRLDGKLNRQRHSIATSPSPEHILVEITRVGGVEKYEVAPKQKLSAPRDTTLVGFGEGVDRRVAAKIDLLMQKDLQLTVTPLVKAGNQTVQFNQRRLQTAAAALLGNIQQLKAGIEAANGIQDEKQRNAAKKQYETNLKVSEEQYGELEKLGAQLEALSKENVYITYRVYYSFGENDVSLINGDIAPEAPEAPVPPHDAEE